jgi:hypothetical protein
MNRPLFASENVMTQIARALIFALTLAFAAAAHAEAPPLLPVQGFLTDAEGEPIDGVTKIRFRLYKTKAADEASKVYEETRDVAVDAGHFTVYLGEVTALDLKHFAANKTLYVGLKIADDAKELTPLLQLATAPYAAHAQTCGDAATLGGKTAEELMSVDTSSAYENLEAEGKLAGDTEDSLLTRKVADLQYTQLAKCYWKGLACNGASECQVTCDEGDNVISGSCDGSAAAANPAFIIEDLPVPSTGYKGNPPGHIYHSHRPEDPNKIALDSWFCRVKEGTALNSVVAFCCPRI